MKRLSAFIVVVIVLTSIFGNVAPANAQGGGANPCPSPDTPGCSFGLPTDQYNAILANIQAQPSPDVTIIPIDKKEVESYTFFRILPDADIFDAPNGNVIGKIQDGFNFVSVYKVQDGFAMMRNKTWLRLTSLKRSYSSAFAGIQISKPLTYPVAWVIQASLPSATPGGVRNPKTPAISRYTLVNIYATVVVDNWEWYLVGPGQWLEQRKVARIKHATRPADATAKWVSVDLYEQVLTAYEGDTMVFATLISSGLTQFQTNLGEFKVWRQAKTTPMSGAMGQPDFYSLPSVPYVMFFDNDISLHGTYWHDGFGFKHSHGCVNMTISDARWVYEWAGAVEGSHPDLTVQVWDSRAA